MSVNKNNICIITGVGGEYGFGHFTRMHNLASFLSPFYNFIFISTDENSALYEETKRFNITTELLRNIAKKKPYLIIVDKRETPIKTIKFFKRLAPVIIVDSIGEERKLADIVIEMLPNAKNDSLVNIKPYLLTILNTNIKPKFEEMSPVLVYVGFNELLKEKVLSIITKIKNKKFIVIDSDKNSYNDNISFKSFSSDIFLTSYSAVITYYGMTAFECISNKIPTVLISPTKYHDTLSKEVSDLFLNIGYFEELDIDNASKKIGDFFEDIKMQNAFVDSGKNIDTEKSMERFKIIIDNMSSFKDIKCPICKSKRYEIKNRNIESNLYKCSKCKTIFRKYFLDPFTDYSSKYFEEDYKKQYGKTYEEDVNNLTALSKGRIKKIKELKPDGNILDLGAAMGFFMKEARESGYEVSGVEISEYASNYCKNVLQLNVQNVSILDFDYEKDKYDIITAWYVLEHIYDFESLFEKIYLSLKTDGVFAFAMPNGYGISGKLNKKYYSLVPSDHAFEANPKSIDILLRRYGFKRYYLENKSIYLNRFLNTFNIKSTPKTLPVKLYDKIASKFNLGDTFECYYIKK